MEIQKIIELRKRLPISLTEAKELLAETDDLVVCEQIYHQNNIKTIQRITQCEEVTANKFYTITKFDVEKAIQKIHEQLVFFTATPNEPLEKIGYVLWEENKGLDHYITSRDKTLFIQSKDFEIVLPIFESVFPLKNPLNDEVQIAFDSVSNNLFDNKTCKDIVQKIAKLKTNDPNVELFLRNLIYWFQTRLRYAEYIVVSGNL
jgi:hypothetical protein